MGLKSKRLLHRQEGLTWSADDTGFSITQIACNFKIALVGERFHEQGMWASAGVQTQGTAKPSSPDPPPLDDDTGYFPRDFTWDAFMER